MAVKAAIFYSDNLFALDLYPGEARERVYDTPPESVFGRRPSFWFKWDGEKLDRGEREFLGLKAFKLDRVSDADIQALRSLGLPRVTCVEAGLVDVEIADVLLWAKRTFHGAEAHLLGWPAEVKS